MAGEQENVAKRSGSKRRLLFVLVLVLLVVVALAVGITLNLLKDDDGEPR